MERTDFAVQLRLLQQAFAAELPERIAALAAGLQALRAGQAGGLTTLQRAAHSLSGASGSFGFPEVGKAARALDQLLKPWLSADGPPPPPTLDQAEALLRALTSQAAQEAQAKPQHGQGDATAPEPYVPGSRRVHLVGQGVHLEQLAEQLAHFGFQVRTCPDGVAARLAAGGGQQAPDAWVVDADQACGAADGIALGEELARQGAAVPLLFISARDDLQVRLAAARAGGAAYLLHPVDAMGLVDRLDALLGSGADEPYRVLVVDDERLLAERTAMVLRGAGMHAEHACSAPAALCKLEEARPELLLMDLHMPDCSGMELARVIRQYEQHAGLPIVYLSGEADLEQQFTALAAGGDDFLTKPISDRRLVLAATARLARARQLTRLMDTDSLTGLLKHGRIKDRLAAELARAGRQGRPLAFAMLDIDHFKRVNDTQGHATGDRVIKSLAMLLKQRLRQSDPIGRWGGEEFAVILPDCNAEQARSMLDSLRQRFAELRFTGTSGEFAVTLSAGLAANHPGHTAADLVAAADAALYRAKDAGRNRIVSADLL